MSVLRNATLLALVSCLFSATAYAQGTLLYVTNPGTDNSVSVYSTNADGTLTSVGTIPVGLNPVYTTVRSDQAFAYTANSNSRTISVIDTATQTVGQTVTVAASSDLLGIALSPDGSTAYVSTRASLTQTVRVFSVDNLTGQLTAGAAINVAQGPRGLAVSPDGSHLYVVNQSSQKVQVINTGTNTIEATLDVGAQPINVAVNANGTRAYVSNFSGASVSVIDTATNTVIATAPTGVGGVYGIAITPDGKYDYVSTRSDSKVHAFDAATFAEIGTGFATGNTQGDLVISPDGLSLYVTNGGADNVSMFTIDPAIGSLTPKVPATIAAGLGPTGGGICRYGNSMLATGRQFVANSAGAINCLGSTPTFGGGALRLNGTWLSIPQSFALGVGGTIDTNGNEATFSGAFSGTGSLTKTGSGVLTLSGANTYTGATAIAAGTVQAGAANVLGVNGAVDVAIGATLNLAGFNQAVGALTGQGTVSLGSGTLTTGGSGNPTFSGSMNGTGGLTKTGSGFLFLQGNNTYSGPTTVSGGGLVVNGSIASSGTTIGTGARLHGTGTASGTVTLQNGSVLVPGAGGPGQLTIGSLVMNGGSTLDLELNGLTPVTQYDRVAVAGTAALGASLVVSPGFTPAPGQTFTILTAAGGVVGTFAGLPNNAVFSSAGTTFRVTYAATSVTLTVVAVPTVTGTASGSVAFGGGISDTATIAGGTSPTGIITFRLFGPGDATCSGTPAFTATTNVAGNGPYRSATFTPSAAGTYRWIASYSGDGVNLSAAGACGDAAQSVTVTKASQTITFVAPGNTTLGAPVPVSASASSTLPVTFTPITPTVCTVSGTTVTLLALGTCTIAADQGGNANYTAAPQVTRSFAILPDCSAVAIGPAALAPAMAGQPYTQAFTLTAGTAPAAFSLTGALPPGLTFANGAITGTPTAHGTYAISVAVTDANSCQVSASYSLAVSAGRRLAIGAGFGASTVRTLTLGSGTPLVNADPFGGFTGGASVAQGDVNGDGAVDIIAGAGPGGGPAIAVMDGVTGATRLAFFVFDPALRSGVEVAAGDLNGDGLPEILAAGGCGAPPVVRAFDGRTGALVREYPIAAPVLSCGLHLAAGDVTADGVADLVVGAGALALSPFVQVIDGVSGAVVRTLSSFEPAFTGSVYVAAGDVTGDGIADIVAAAGSGGAPQVRIFDGVTGAPIPGPLGSFLAYTAAFAGGVRVGAGDLTGDGRAEVITAAGPGGGPHVRVFDGASGAEIYGVFGFDPAFAGGVFVAGPPAAGRMAVDIPAARTTGTGVRIAGWALRETSADSVGTDAIHAWAMPATGGAPVFVGAAPTRVPRPDVAAAFGGEFLMSGYDFYGTLAPGTYDLIVFARNSRTLRFDQARVVRITVP